MQCRMSAPRGSGEDLGKEDFSRRKFTNYSELEENWISGHYWDTLGPTIFGCLSKSVICHTIFVSW